MGAESADRHAYLAWFRFGPRTFEAYFGLSMGEENADRGVYVDTRTRGQGRAAQEEKKEKEEGWKSANENENPHTVVVGKRCFHYYTITKWLNLGLQAFPQNQN